MYAISFASTAFLAPSAIVSPAAAPKRVGDRPRLVRSSCLCSQ